METDSSATPPLPKTADAMTVQVHGAKVTFQSDGSLAIDLKEIRNVSIKNVMEVEVHGIHTIVDSRSHYIRFHGGGEVRFAYNKDGRLIELWSRNVTLSVTPDNDVIFSRKAEETKT